MAWWTNMLFFGWEKPEEENKGTTQKEESIFALFRRALKDYIYKHFVTLLYYLLSILTYLYLGLSIITFFFHRYVPKSFPYIIDALSEPYLGALGIYVVIKEIERRREKKLQKHWGELFTITWLIFFITATFFAYFSEEYRLGTVYKTVVTNALAAIIIRIGTLIR